MRIHGLVLAFSVTFSVLAASQAMAVNISGDARFDSVTSHEAEIEANPLMNGGCEILIYYEWPRDPSQAIIVQGSDDRRRSERWHGGDLDLVGAPAAGGYDAGLSFMYRDTVGEDGVRRRLYSAYLTLIQVGPFSVGQSFGLSPDANDPGAATSTLTATLTAADLAAATANGNAGFDHYQAQCGQ